MMVAFVVGYLVSLDIHLFPWLDSSYDDLFTMYWIVHELFFDAAVLY